MLASERLLCAVGQWGLRDVSQAWVDTTWELDFTETEPLDSKLEAAITDNGLDAFSQLYEALHPFAAGDHETTENAWTLFAENNISHNAFVAVWYHFVQEAQSKKASVNQRLYALHAAGLYFLLLEIPGSIVNRMFHQVMFEKCLQTLSKCWPQDSDLSRKRKKDHGKSCKGDRKKRGKSLRRMDKTCEEDDDDDDDQEEDIYFSAHQLLQIREALFLLLKNLLRLLSKFSLKERPQCMQACIQTFVRLMSFEPCVHGFESSERMTVGQAKYVPELACIGLQLLCSPLHSVEDKVLHLVFHRLLAVILMLPGRDASSGVPATITSQVVGARNLAIRFISFLIKELKEVAFRVLRILLQHICVKVPNKSEYRTQAALAVAQLMYKFPCAGHADFIAWLYKYSHNDKSSYRVFALDVALALLDLPEREEDIALSEKQKAFLKHKFLVQEMILERCWDEAATVCSKALSSFAHCLEAKATLNTEIIQELLQGTASSTVEDSNMPARTLLTNTEGSSSQSLKTFPAFQTIEVTEPCNTAEFDGKEFMDMLRDSTADENTNVRKSALQVLMSLLKHRMVPCTLEDLVPLRDRCRDGAISVRKQSLQCITDLLQSQPDNVLIQKAWVTGVVPVVMDCEDSVKGKALEFLDRFLLQPIKHCNKFSQQDRSQVLAWDLLTHFTKECQELSHYLNKAFHIWSRQEKFSSAFVNSVISHTETERAATAWMLLAKVSSSSPKLDYTKIIEAWESISREPGASWETVVHILCVIGNIAKHLPNSIRSRLMDDMKCWLQDSQCPLEVISPAIDTLQNLCNPSAEASKEALDMMNNFFGDLVAKCEHCISSIVLQQSRGEQIQEDILVRYLSILGDAAQLCPAKVEKRIFLLIQSILASPDSLDQVSSLEDSEDLPPSQPLSQFRGSVFPCVVRAYAFVTLGKLCLQHDDLANKSIPALARELELSKDVPVRNNIVIVICDLCIRYATMADRYIPDVAACLKDPEPLIQRQTLILLTNLLQQEYVKWKGSLFFRFVSVLVDPHPEIASLAKFCLVHILLKRNPVMFSQHFMECIFHFNSYEKHEKYNRFPQSEREKKRFSLKGEANKEKRMEIYKFLLEHFTDEQRFNLTSKISLNILACFADGALPLDLEASTLLSDTFEVLSCKEIKLSAMKSQPEDDIEPDEDQLAMANVVMQVAKKKMISHVQKKNLIENVIPIITSLKTSLEQKRLPALRELMTYLREVMQDYRNEIKEFFATDKQLAAELEYDMRKYEEQLQMESERDQELPRGTGALHVPAVAQTPASERAALPSDQNAAASARDSAPVGITSPRPGTLNPSRRSLNTFAIINNAKKVAEAVCNQHSRSLGERPTSPGRGQSSKVFLASLNRPSSSGSIPLEGRAISTPEKSIDDVTFGAGVSHIHTPASDAENQGDQDPSSHIICLPPLDSPSPAPQQWNIVSPARRSSPSSTGLRRSSSKTPQRSSKGWLTPSKAPACTEA